MALVVVVEKAVALMAAFAEFVARGARDDDCIGGKLRSPNATTTEAGSKVQSRGVAADAGECSFAPVMPEQQPSLQQLTHAKPPLPNQRGADARRRMEMAAQERGSAGALGAPHPSSALLEGEDLVPVARVTPTGHTSDPSPTPELNSAVLLHSSKDNSEATTGSHGMSLTSSARATTSTAAGGSCRASADL